MTRFALVLVAILALVLSAGLTPTKIPAAAGGQMVVTQPGMKSRPIASDAAIALASRPAASSAHALAGPTTNDPPAPAVLIYLVLVLAGSAISVALVRRNQA